MNGKQLVQVDPLQFAHDRAEVARGFWGKVRATLGAVPFLEDAVAAYFCAVDRETPMQVKAVLVGALAYFVVPADMIPDVVAWLGFTDDAAVVATAIRTVAPHIGQGHREQARQMLGTFDDEASGA